MRGGEGVREGVREGGDLFMPSVLPDFGTNIKNGHEERIRDYEQTQETCREEKSQSRGAGW